MFEPMIKLMVTIVDRGRGDKAAALFKSVSLPIHYACPGLGTAGSEIMEYLGLGETQKDVVLTLVPGPMAASVMAEAAEKLHLSKPGTGVMFTVGLTSISAAVSKLINEKTAQEFRVRARERRVLMKKEKHDLVVVVVNHGCTDLVMEAAREAGAKGGTILHACRLGYGDGGVRPEKEIVAVLAPKAMRQQLMDLVSKAAGINTEAKGVMFSLPVEEITGLTEPE